MGGRGGGGGAKATNANAGVPAFARKVVGSLKEIVNCSELEIYAMLVECDMDPDETVTRLLSQDTFHEVKSKRDKKKETKEPADSWTRSSNNSNRGGRSGNDSYNNPRGSGGNKYSSNETGNANRRENGTRNHWANTGSSGLLGRQPPSNSDFVSGEVKKQPTGSFPSDAGVASSSSTLPSHPPAPAPAYPSAWVNANPGQRTMADIVKMGIKPIHQQKNVVARSSETTQETKNAPVKEEWPSMPSMPSIVKQDVSGETNLDETTRLDHHHPETLPDAAPVSVSSRNLLDDDFRDASLRENENNNDAERHTFEDKDVEDVSASVATCFQQLTIENEEDEDDEYYEEALPKEDKPAVIIPDHLQVHTLECSHLMFGSFGAPALRSEETHEEAEDDSSFRHQHEADYYGEEEEDEEPQQQLRTDEQYQVDQTARNYHQHASETEAAVAATQQQQQQQHEQPPPQEDQHHQYKFSSSSPADYGFEQQQQQQQQQLNHLPISSSETNPQMQNLDSFPNVMQQGYTSSLPNTLLPSGIQDPRGEPDLHYSPFPTKYNTAAPSSLTGPAISMAEALRAASISPQNAGQQQQQQAAAAALAQQLAMNPYSHHQPGLPLGHYGNLISYPFMPQSYSPYMPSAFQHQSLAAMLPQYKTQATASPSAPPPPPSAYAFGVGGVAAASSNNNFALNPTSATNSYEDVLSSQLRDSNHLASSLQQQQNENSAAASWHQAQQQQQANSRVVPGSGYYSFPGHQNQQPPGFRQAQPLQQQQQQQPSQLQQQQHYGGQHSGGYVSPYHSQAGAMSLDHLHHQHQQQQQQLARDAASKQNQQQQLWPNNNY